MDGGSRRRGTRTEARATTGRDAAGAPPAVDAPQLAPSAQPPTGTGNGKAPRQAESSPATRFADQGAGGQHLPRYPIMTTEPTSTPRTSPVESCGYGPARPGHRTALRVRDTASVPTDRDAVPQLLWRFPVDALDHVHRGNVVEGTRIAARSVEVKGQPPLHRRRVLNGHSLGHRQRLASPAELHGR